MLAVQRSASRQQATPADSPFPRERHGLAGTNAPLETDLLRQYRAWADVTGVLDWEIALPKLLEAWKMDSPEG